MELRPSLLKKMTGKANLPPLPLIEGNEKIREIKTLEDQSQLTTIYTERASPVY